MKFKNRQNSSKLIEMRMVVTLEGGGVSTNWKFRGALSDDGNNYSFISYISVS